MVLENYYFKVIILNACSVYNELLVRPLELPDCRLEFFTIPYIYSKPIAH